MKRLLTIFFSLFLVSNLFAADDAKALGKDPIIKAMDAELKRSIKKLSKVDPPIYFLSYQINL